MPSQIRRVETLDAPELQSYRTLRRPAEHIERGIFIAEGEKVVRRLLDSDLNVLSMLLTPEWLAVLQPDPALLRRSVQCIQVAEKSLLESIVGFNVHQGIMAEAMMPAEPTLEDILNNSKTPALFVALDGLVNSENVGVVVRNCAAFGVDAILVGETSSSPYLRRAVRNSMGTVFRMRVHHCRQLPAALAALNERAGVVIVGADPHDSRSIHEASIDGNVCIVLGNEGDGLSEPVMQACTQRVAIPMSGGTDSLNVGSASAVLLYEIQRRRRKD